MGVCCCVLDTDSAEEASADGESGVYHDDETHTSMRVQRGWTVIETDGDIYPGAAGGGGDDGGEKDKEVKLTGSALKYIVDETQAANAGDENQQQKHEENDENDMAEKKKKKRKGSEKHEEPVAMVGSELKDMSIFAVKRDVQVSKVDITLRQNSDEAERQEQKYVTTFSFPTSDEVMESNGITEYSSSTHDYTYLDERSVDEFLKRSQGPTETEERSFQNQYKLTFGFSVDDELESPTDRYPLSPDFTHVDESIHWKKIEEEMSRSVVDNEYSTQNSRSFETSTKLELIAEASIENNGDVTEEPQISPSENGRLLTEQERSIDLTDIRRERMDISDTYKDSNGAEHTKSNGSARDDVSLTATHNNTSTDHVDELSVIGHRHTIDLSNGHPGKHTHVAKSHSVDLDMRKFSATTASDEHSVGVSPTNKRVVHAVSLSDYRHIVSLDLTKSEQDALVPNKVLSSRSSPYHRSNLSRANAVSFHNSTDEDTLNTNIEIEAQLIQSASLPLNSTSTHFHQSEPQSGYMESFSDGDQLFNESVTLIVNKNIERQGSVTSTSDISSMSSSPYEQEHDVKGESPWYN